MKRRDFLATPALGMLIPGAAIANRLTPFAEFEKTGSGTAAGDAQVQQRMHPDFITYFPGIEYFYLGNGDIQGAVQYSPKDQQATFLGFTLMDPEHFCRKWSTFLYHPERGFSNTKLGVTVGDAGTPHDNKTGMYYGVKGYSLTPENLIAVGWKYPDGVPVVSVAWKAGSCEVEEEFFVPSEGALLFRRINVKNVSSGDIDVKLGLSLYPNFGLFDTIYTDEEEKTAHASGVARMKLLSPDRATSVAGRYDVRIDVGTVKPREIKQGTYIYAINDGDRLLAGKDAGKMWTETVKYWNEKSSFVSGYETLDHLYNVSRTDLRAVVSRSGKMDAGTWMYNMEWLSDHILAVEALLRSGCVAEAKVLFEKNLAKNIGKDGRTIESGRWFGYDYTEINQNGILLYGVWVYLAWTGDIGLIKKYWDRIKLCADFPLQEVFLEKTTHMVHNKREFWERSDSHGIENGYELAYQFWISFGLEKAAAVARLVGDSASAEKWSDAGEKMKQAMLGDPKFKLIEDGHFIKRRTLDGKWQRYLIPPDRGRMPAGSPLATEDRPSAEPDTVTVAPIIFGMVDPRGELSLKTLAWVEQLWNQRWEMGGYPRYDASSEDNPPAPWPIASMLVARAYAAAGDDRKVRRVLEWLRTIHGGLSGNWFERYGQSITPPMPPVNVVGWIWYELIALCSYHIAGFKPDVDSLAIRPWLMNGVEKIVAAHTVRGARVNLTVRRSKGVPRATINGKETNVKEGGIIVPYPIKEQQLTIEMEL